MKYNDDYDREDCEELRGCSSILSLFFRYVDSLIVIKFAVYRRDRHGRVAHERWVAHRREFHPRPVNISHHACRGDK